MANFLRRGFIAARPHGNAALSSVRSFASLVEVKPGEVGIISGIPEEQLRRRVLIYSPARTPTQQGSGKDGKWKINFMSTQKWENPLMGRTSTGDPYANVGDAGLSFDSALAAKEFAEKHGWEYLVKNRHTHTPPKVYDAYTNLVLHQCLSSYKRLSVAPAITLFFPKRTFVTVFRAKKQASKTTTKTSRNKTRNKK